MQKAVQSFISGLSAKEKKLLIVTGVIVCVTLFDRMVLGPITGESQRAEERIEEETKLIHKNLLILRYKDKVLGEDKAYGDFYTKKGQVEEELIASFLSEVESMAKASNVALVNINPVAVAEKVGYVEFSLTLECAGTMKDMLSFMYTIDNAKKPLRTVSYDIQPKSRENYEVRCILTVVKMIILPDGTMAVIKPTAADEKAADSAESGASPAPGAAQ